MASADRTGSLPAATAASSLSAKAMRVSATAAGKDPVLSALAIVAESWKAHRRVVLNGNGYAAEWAREAEARGLPSFKSAVDAIPEFMSPSNAGMLARLGILSEEESESRCHIYLERYAKQINIEAGVMVEMARRSILPAALASAETFARTAATLAAVGATSAVSEQKARKLAALAAKFSEEADRLEKSLESAQEIEEALACARGYREIVVPGMDALREIGDEIERAMPKGDWPFPNYEDLLFTL
jgi:glutamine synthetase